MQTFYLSYKVMQTLLMTAVLLSLIVTLFLLLMFHDMRIDKKKWHDPRSDEPPSDRHLLF